MPKQAVSLLTHKRRPFFIQRFDQAFFKCLVVVRRHYFVDWQSHNRTMDCTTFDDSTLARDLNLQLSFGPSPIPTRLEQQPLIENRKRLRPVVILGHRSALDRIRNVVQ
jgi:hypothetical protein